MQDQAATRTTRTKAKEIATKQPPRQTAKKIMKRAKSVDLGSLTAQKKTKQRQNESLTQKRKSFPEVPKATQAKKTLIVEDIDMNVEEDKYEEPLEPVEEERKMIITVDKSKLIPEDVEDKQNHVKINTIKNDMQLAIYKPEKNSAQNQLKPPTLQNVVATANLNCKKLDLRKIAQWCRNAEYNPSRFSAVIMRIRNPKTTALIFSTGKIVITGAKSENDIMMAARIFEKTVQKVIEGDVAERMGDLDKGMADNALVQRVNLSDLKIQNIVASTDVGFSIKLEELKEEQK